MARAAARSGPSTRMLENGRIEFWLDDLLDLFFIGWVVWRKWRGGARWAMRHRMIELSRVISFEFAIEGLLITDIIRANPLALMLSPVGQPESWNGITSSAATIGKPM